LSFEGIRIIVIPVNGNVERGGIMRNKSECRVVVVTEEERAELLRAASSALENVVVVKCSSGSSSESNDASQLGWHWFKENKLQSVIQKLSITKPTKSNISIYLTLGELEQVSMAGEIALSYFESAIFQQPRSPLCDDPEYLALSSAIDKVAEAIVYGRS
jgi:hypothetical protein